MSIQDVLLQFVGIGFIGSVIKLMDDYFDEELDYLLEKKTLAMRLQTSTLPYSLLLFTLAVLLIREMAISLFLASYILGMHSELEERQPSGLKGYQESLLLTLLLFLTIHPLEVMTSFSIILTIQIIDDYVDYYTEPFPGRGNLIKRLGKSLSLLLLFFLLLFTLYIDPVKGLMVLLATPIIIYLMERRTIKERGDKREWTTSMY